MFDQPVIAGAEQTITVVRGGTNRHGDPTTPAEHQVSGCLVFPTPRTRGVGEIRDRSDIVLAGQEVLAPVGSDVKATDRIRLAGEPAGSARWEVDGDVGDWGVGIQFAITKATG